jgi:hypothetical protein
MVDDWLARPHLFDSDEYLRIAHLPLGVDRKR